MNCIEDNLKIKDKLKAPSSLFEIRRGIYKFLSAVFLNPPGKEMISIFSNSDNIADLEDVLGDDVTSCFKEFSCCYNDCIDELEQEYRDLFIIPLGKYVTPYESVYRGGKKIGEEYIKGQLMGAQSLSVKKFYARAGIDISATNELPDHIGLELEAMHFLCINEFKCRTSEKEDEAKNIIKLQKQFMDEHISQWIDDLCQNIYDKTDSNFYKGIAMLTRRFIEIDKNTLKEI